MPRYIHPRLDANERFRERRRQALRRRRRRRLAAAAVLLALGAGIGLGATQISGGHRAARPPSRPPILVDKPLVPRPYPTEVRGVHVTAPLAGLPGKLEDYTALKAFGLNTIEVDVKDENGQVGFVTRDVPALAREIGAARPYYDVESVVARVHAAGMYLIGRVVVFEDPTLSAERPRSLSCARTARAG